MILFDKRKFIKNEGEADYERCKRWVDKCHGEEVKSHMCNGFIIRDNWTVNTDDLVFSLEEYKKSVPRPYSWANECDGEPVIVDGASLCVKGKDGGKYIIKLEWCVEKSKQEESKMVETKYKAGDKVIVREDLVVNRLYGIDEFVSSMEKFKGKTVTISRVTAKGEYNLEEDKYGFFWTDEMFAGLSKVSPKQLLQSGDVVVNREGNSYLVIVKDDETILMNSNGHSYRSLVVYNDDLIHESDNDADVMSIHRTRVGGFYGTFRYVGDNNLIWKREEPKEDQKDEPENQDGLDSDEITEEDIEEFVDFLLGMLKCE